MEKKLEELKGKTINNILINKTKDLLILYVGNWRSGTKVYYMTFIGDCCAKCFIAHVSGYDRRFTVVDIEQSEWKTHWPTIDPDTYNNVIETMGVKIKTDKGYIDIETRLEHNGYYDGTVQLSTEYPITQYGLAWNFKGEEFEDLRDF